MFYTDTSNKLYTYESCVNKITFLFNNTFLSFIYFILLLLLLKIKILNMIIENLNF